LKTHYLGGKCNWCVDCIICTLVLKVVPDFNFKHRRQLAKIEGRNLKDLCCQQIKASARNISPDSIHYIGGTTFYVALQSHPGHHYYVINLTQSACNCNDFPRIQYCKHIAAINVHFPQLCPKGNSPSKILECVCTPNLPEHVRVPNMPEHMRISDMPKCKHTTPRSEEESAEIILKDINALCQQLCAVSHHSSLDLQTIKAIKYSVTSLGTWPTFFFLFLTDMYLYDHMIATHMTAYLYNRAILSGTPLFPPFVCSPLFSPYGSL